MKAPKIFSYIFVAAAAVLLLFVVYKTFISEKSKPVDNFGQTQTGGVADPSSVPTLTPEEEHIVANIQTLSIEVTDTAVTPSSLTVKQYDQVAFVNKTSGTIKIDGVTWGKVPLGSGENMTQAFREIGTFNYTVPELNLKGQIVVK